MSNIYMLNLIFDANDASAVADSRFEEDDTSQTNLLQRSKVWLVAINTQPGQDNPSDWNLEQADTGDPLQLQDGDEAWIRVQGLNTTSSWVARMTTVISRHSKLATQNPSTQKPYQKRGSPFPLGTTSQSCVLFDYENYTYQPISAGSSWLQQLGAATLATSTAPLNSHDSYSVIVAITAGVGANPGQGQNTDPTSVQVYSHDPDMDVQC